MQDALQYDEPPPWYVPERQILAATLLAAGRPGEAEVTYRDDLARNPENGWSLFGLARALRLQKRDAEADLVDARFRKMWSHADVTLSATCFCQQGL